MFLKPAWPLRNSNQNTLSRSNMNTLEKYKHITEVKGTQYTSGTDYTARVVKLGNKHIAKFFNKGEHMKDADYEGQNEKDAHEFANDEMEYRKKQKNESVDGKDHIEQTLASADINSKVDGQSVKVHKDNKAKAARIVKRMGYSHKVESGLNESDDLNERINMPQGHKETPDPISDDSSKHGAVKKMMGNKKTVDIVAKILARK